MKVSPYLVHEAMQNAPIDDVLYRQARAAIANVLDQLGTRFTFTPRGCGRRHGKPELWGFCSADHSVLCIACESDQPR